MTEIRSSVSRLVVSKRGIKLLFLAVLYRVSQRLFLCYNVLENIKWRAALYLFDNNQ